MDIKNVDSSRLQATDTLRNRKAPAQSDSGSSAPINKAADNTSDLSNTARVVGVGRAEAMKLHQAELQQIAKDIETGNYSADITVVAERVAQILMTLK